MKIFLWEKTIFRGSLRITEKNVVVWLRFSEYCVKLRHLYNRPKTTTA